MSRASVTPQDENVKGYRRAWGQIYQLIRMGGSLSGQERNCAFLNMRDGQFGNISAVSGIDYPDDGRSLVIVDWDQDGDLDMWTTNRTAPRLRFLRNNGRHTGHFVALRLVGNGTTTNRDAVGARIEMITAPAASSPQITTLRAGEGFISQNSKWIHFGLGDATEVGQIVVHWPGGEIERFTGMAVDKRYVLVQGSGRANEAPDVHHQIALTPKKQEPLPEPSQLTLRLITPIESPPLPYRTFDGEQRMLRPVSGQPLVINLWASWCKPCLKELKEIAQARDDIKAAGLTIVALSVDGMDDQETGALQAAKFIKSIDFPFASGLATKQVLDGLQALHDIHTPMLRPLPLPCSFLIDARGRLTAIYEGAISIREILEDVKKLDGTDSERIVRAASFPGRVIEHEIVRLAQRRRESDLRFRVAKFLQTNGLWADEAIQYETLLGLEIDLDRVHAELGAALIRQKQFDRAEEHLTKALRLDPGSISSHVNLGGILFKKRDFTRAAEHFSMADNLEPGNAQTLFNLSLAYMETGKYELAAKALDRAIEVKPNFVRAHVQRAMAHDKLGRPEDVIKDLTIVIERKPNFVPALLKRATVLRNLEKWALAIQDYDRLITLQPETAKNYNDRGFAHSSLGNYAKAIEDYEKAIEWQPTGTEAHNNLGWLLATCPDKKYRNGELAIEEAELTCELLEWKEPNALDTLAAAHACAGQFEDAIRWQIKAIDLAPEPAKAAMRRRLEDYRANKPYYDSPNR